MIASQTVKYCIVEERYMLEDKYRTSYGIAAYEYTEHDETASVIASVHDITCDKSDIIRLVAACNRLELSPVHLFDVVEDFMI